MPTPNDRGPHRPRTNIQYHVENGWVVPDQPQTPPRRTSTQEQRRAAARRARAKRRRRRQLALIGTACGILVVSGVITALLPAKGADAPLTSDAPANTRLVAPVPYAGSNGSAGTAQALNWGTVGPQRQSADTGYTYTALPAAPAALPEFGRVDTSWFADAAFLGDSLTAGFCVNDTTLMWVVRWSAAMRASARTPSSTAPPSPARTGARRCRWTFWPRPSPRSCTS